VLHVQITDSLSGVNIAGDIGHQITMTLDEKFSESKDITEFFEYDKGSYVAGRLKYNLYDLEGYIHLDQYLSNYLLPNKEYFMGNFVNVENPFLDNDILDFMMKIPVSLRFDRRLYKDTVSQMFPQLFAIKRAKFNEYYTDWGKELFQHQKEIEASLYSQKSILDELIPPENIIKFMRNGLISKTSLMTRGREKVKSNGSRIVKAFEKIIGHSRPPEIKKPSRPEMLRRILVMRSFLNMTVD